MKNFNIGYTTGVFDLFHVGHLNILMRAKEQCNYLIVGISTDEVVQEYKKKNPIIPFNERFAIVDAIKYVDKVVPQISMDKFIAWEKYNFDVIFHGDDWKGTIMYEEIEKNFNKVGVTTVYFPYTKGTSSTILGDTLTMILEEQKRDKLFLDKAGTYDKSIT